MSLDNQEVYGAKWVQIDDSGYYWIYERGVSPPSNCGRLPVERHVVPASSTNLKAYTRHKYIETRALIPGVITNIDSAVDLRDSMPVDITFQNAEHKTSNDVCLSLSSIQQQLTSEFTSVTKSIDSAVPLTEPPEFLEASDETADQFNSIRALSHREHSTLIDASGHGKEHTIHAAGEHPVHDHVSVELEELTKPSLHLLATPVEVNVDDRSLANFYSVTNATMSDHREKISVSAIDEALLQETLTSKDESLPTAPPFEPSPGVDKAIDESFDSEDNSGIPVPLVTEEQSSTKGSIDNLVKSGELKASVEGLNPINLDYHEAPAYVYDYNSSDDDILDIPTTLQNFHGLSNTKSEAVVSRIRSDRNLSLLASYSRHDNFGVPDLVSSNDGDTDVSEEPNSPSSPESYKPNPNDDVAFVANSFANKEVISASGEKNPDFTISNISGVDETPYLSDGDTSSSVLDCPTVKISAPTLSQKEHTVGGDLGCDEAQDLTPESLHGAHRNDLTANVYTSTGTPHLPASLKTKNRRESNNSKQEEPTIEEIALESIAFEEHAFKKLATEEDIVDRSTLSEPGVDAPGVPEAFVETSSIGPLQDRLEILSSTTGSACWPTSDTYGIPSVLSWAELDDLDDEEFLNSNFLLTFQAGPTGPGNNPPPAASTVRKNSLVPNYAGLSPVLDPTSNATGDDVYAEPAVDCGELVEEIAQVPQCSEACSESLGLPYAQSSVQRCDDATATDWADLVEEEVGTVSQTSHASLPNPAIITRAKFTHPCSPTGFSRAFKSPDLRSWIPDDIRSEVEFFRNRHEDLEGLRHTQLGYRLSKINAEWYWMRMRTGMFHEMGGYTPKALPARADYSSSWPAPLQFHHAVNAETGNVCPQLMPAPGVYFVHGITLLDEDVATLNCPQYKGIFYNRKDLWKDTAAALPGFRPRSPNARLKTFWTSADIEVEEKEETEPVPVVLGDEMGQSSTSGPTVVDEEIAFPIEEAMVEDRDDSTGGSTVVDEVTIQETEVGGEEEVGELTDGVLTAVSEEPVVPIQDGGEGDGYSAGGSTVAEAYIVQETQDGKEEEEEKEELWVPEEGVPGSHQSEGVEEVIDLTKVKVAVEVVVGEPQAPHANMLGVEAEISSRPYTKYNDSSEIPVTPTPSFPEYLFGTFAIGIGRLALGMWR